MYVIVKHTDKWRLKNMDTAYINKKPRARVVFFSCLAEKHSIKDLTKAWYKPKDSYKNYSNALYQDGLSSTLMKKKLIDMVEKGEGNEILLKTNQDAFMEWLNNMAEQDLKSLGLKNDLMEKSNEIKKYLESDFIKEYLSLDNLKKYFNNEVLTFEKECLKVIPSLLFVLPVILKGCKKNSSNATKEQKQKMDYVMNLALLGMGSNVKLIHAYEVIEKHLNNLHHIPEWALTDFARKDVI